jgi:hypothetical protein
MESRFAPTRIPRGSTSSSRRQGQEYSAEAFPKAPSLTLLEMQLVTPVQLDTAGRSASTTIVHHHTRSPRTFRGRQHFR